MLFVMQPCAAANDSGTAEIAPAQAPGLPKQCEGGFHSVERNKNHLDSFAMALVAPDCAPGAFEVETPRIPSPYRSR